MFKILVVILALASLGLPAELPSNYVTLEKHTFKPDIINEGLPAHAVHKKEPKAEPESPVYRGEEHINKGRAHIAPVKPRGPVIRHEGMLADQPASSTEVNRIDNLAASNYGYDQNPSEVNYPDIPYAPGYGYDKSYASSNNYDLYDNDYLMEPDMSTFSLLWSQVPDARTIVGFVGNTITNIFSNMFLLLLGSLLTVGVCSYTNLCTFVFHGVGPIHEEMRSLISPERLDKISTAADFVKNAIDKYQKIQKITDVDNKRNRRANKAPLSAKGK